MAKNMYQSMGEGGNCVVEIYALCHPVSGEVRYVGKANNTSKRLITHIRDSRRRDTPVYRWIRKLAAENLTPTARVLEKCNGPWQDAEIRLIAEYKKTGRLLNVALGGDEPCCPLDVRQSNGRKSALSRVSTPLKQRVYKLNHMVGVFLRDGLVTEQVKTKLRYAAAKRPDLFGRWANI